MLLNEKDGLKHLYRSAKFRSVKVFRKQKTERHKLKLASGYVSINDFEGYLWLRICKSFYFLL